MNAKEYWSTSRYLDRKYKREADQAAKVIEKQKSDAAAKQGEARLRREKALVLGKVKFWDSLKVGDALFNGKVIVAKKNKLSVVSAHGSRYTIEEVIGGEAARVYRQRSQHVKTGEMNDG